jgi:hypothetical protein
MSPEERQQLERDTQLAVYRFQSDAYRNLRHSIAAAVIVFGLFVGSDVFFGHVNGAQLWSRLVLLLSMFLAAGYFTTTSRPRLSLWLLLAAAAASIIGIALLITFRAGAS